jgi:predicted acyltransferase
MRPVGEYLPGLDPVAALTGIVAGAWFPILPWLAFPVAGLVLGRQLSGGRVRTSKRWILLGLAGLAAGLGLALLALRLGHANPVTEYLSVFSLTPDSMSMVVFQFGLVLVLLGIAHWAIDGRTQGRWMAPVRLVSRYALTVYVLSYLLIFAIVHVADLLDASRSHEFDTVTSGWALLIGVALVVAIVPGLAAWDRHGGVGSLEWVMSRLRVGATRNLGQSRPSSAGAP